jgi:hypothetical protein
MSLVVQTADLQTCVVNDRTLKAIRESEQFLVVTGAEAETIESQALVPNFWAFNTKMVAIAGTFSCHVMLSDQDWVNFRRYVAQWHSERGVTSSPVYMAMCPAYQRILAMGKRAIPLILRQLEIEGDDPDHWFWALNFLTNSDPVLPEDRGDMKKMSAAWVNWGQRNRNAW